MDTEALHAFLTKPYDAILSVNRPGKGAHLTPIWFLWDGEQFLFCTQTATAKYVHIRRDPQISLIINEPETRTAVTASGRAEILGSERHAEVSKAIIKKYVPEQARGSFIAALQANERSQPVVIALKPEHMRGWTAPA